MVDHTAHHARKLVSSFFFVRTESGEIRGVLGDILLRWYSFFSATAQASVGVRDRWLPESSYYHTQCDTLRRSYMRCLFQNFYCI